MQFFLLAIDYSMPLLMLFWLLRKGSLSIMYVPVVYFAYSMLEQSKIIPIYLLMFVALLAYYVFFHLQFLTKNIFYVILIIFFTFQLRLLNDWHTYRIYIIGLYWTFTIVALAPEICRNFSKEVLFDEASKAGFLILGLFVLNSILATALGYFPKNKYGFTSGVSFGHVDISEYNVLPIAVFLVFRKGIKDKNLLFIAIGIAALFLTFLTMRRMVMALALLGMLIAMVELVNLKQIKQLFLYLLVFGIIGAFVAWGTGFSDQLIERFEKRNLGERDLESELRYLEFGLVYKDLFVFYDYDPWFGYGPIQSWGNYGKSIFGNRPLHSDITYFIHGLGFFGFFLYLGMVSWCFLLCWKNCSARGDYLMFGFVLLYFGAFFLVGSPKTPMSPVLLFMILGIILGRDVKKSALVKDLTNIPRILAASDNNKNLL